jgi:hypothetical protein
MYYTLIKSWINLQSLRQHGRNINKSLTPLNLCDMKENLSIPFHAQEHLCRKNSERREDEEKQDMEGWHGS